MLVNEGRKESKVSAESMESMASTACKGHQENQAWQALPDRKVSQVFRGYPACKAPGVFKVRRVV